MTEYIINTLVFLFTCVPTSFDVFIMSKKRLSDAKTLIFNVFKHLKRNQYLLLVNLFQYTVESAYKSRICPRKKTTYKRKRLVNEFNLFQPSSSYHKRFGLVTNNTVRAYIRVNTFSQTYYETFVILILINMLFKLEIRFQVSLDH